MGPVKKLSPRFVEFWRKCVGGEPTIDLINRIIRESMQVQCCKDLVNAIGRNERQLAIYWHPGHDVLVKIDKISGVAVTVFTPQCWEQKNYWKR